MPLQLSAKRKILLSELLESSDSSDDEEFILFCYRQDILKVNNFIKITNYYDDEKFRANLRLSRCSFDKLVRMFKESHFMPKSNRGRSGVSAERQIMVFLWFAGTKQVYRNVAELFDITISSLHRILNRVLGFFYEIAPRHIYLPHTPQMKAEIAENFRKIAKFPNVIGCIDGSYIPIQTPAHKLRMTYVNRHHQTALTLQGVCDSRCRFLDVITGFSSKIHDSRVFKLSSIYPKMKDICGPNHTYHFLGDAAYAISGTLMKPFTYTGNLTAEEKRFNKALSQTRVKIENAFGLLKGRFRQLIRLDFHTVEKNCYFIIACCVLHNLCIEWNEIEFPPEENAAFINEQNQFIDEGPQEREIGEIKRQLIVATLFTDP